MRYLDGSQWADPRLCRSYCPSNMECWLDIEQLGSAQDDSMFGQIAAGLKKCKVRLRAGHLTSSTNHSADAWSPVTTNHSTSS